jgi:regulator of sigma E protease
MDIIAQGLLDVLTETVWPIVQFLIGLDLVVFVHELGHCLVAKRVGIKVERFAVGFGPRLFGLVRGGTDYCLCLLPIGGYVKMLGQEDFAPLDQRDSDPRAYHNKPVSARLAVIGAGVVMNVILAGVLFVIVCMIGKEFPKAVVGEALPGWPAATAKITWQTAPGAPNAAPATSIGLKGGDEIVALDDDAVTRFDTIKITAVLAGYDDTFRFRIRRRHDGQQRVGTATIGVKPGPEELAPAFGIVPAASAVINMPKDAVVDVPFREGDEVIEVAGRPVSAFWQIRRIAETMNGSPVAVKLRRKGAEQPIVERVVPALRNADEVFRLEDGTTIRGHLIARDGEEGTVTLLLADGREKTLPRDGLTVVAVDEMLNILGMIPRLSFAGVAEGTPAHRAGLKPGDIVVSYAEREGITRKRLGELNEQFRQEGTHLVVLRDGRRHRVWIRPSGRNNPTIGVIPSVDQAHAVVGAVQPGSPADAAGVQPAATLLAVSAEDPNGRRTRRPLASWIDLYQALCAFRGREVSLTYRLGSRTRTESLGVLDANAFDPAAYTFRPFPYPVLFEPLTVTVRHGNPLRALAWGAAETGRMIVRAYASLRSMLRGTVSTRGVVGPVGLGGLAVGAARQSPVQLVYLMAFISAIIAVFNFLPIPFLDGGHALFLMIEKIRGRPLPLRLMNAIQMTGLVLILALFLLITWQDIVRLVKGG